MTTLIEILKKETESLKIQYLEMTKNWAINNFKMLQSDKRFKLYDSGLYHRQTYGSTKSEYAQIAKIENILNKGIDLFISEKLQDALYHYETSILKLEDRINIKGLNIENLRTLTSHIGVNIETILTDGLKTVKAFTIIAEGEIQRPHYRYLIK